MTIVTSNKCLCPGPYSLKHIRNHDSCPLNASTPVYDSSAYVCRRCLEQFLGGILNTLLLRYHQKIKHMQMSQGVLMATMDHNSTQLHSVCLQHWCVDEQVHRPAATIHAWKLPAAAVQSACASEIQLFLHSPLRLPVFSHPELNLQALSEDIQNQLMVSYCNDQKWCKGIIIKARVYKTTSN